MAFKHHTYGNEYFASKHRLNNSEWYLETRYQNAYLFFEFKSPSFSNNGLQKANMFDVW